MALFLRLSSDLLWVETVSLTGKGFFFARSFAAIMATIVEQEVAKIDGTRMAAGFDAPAAARTAITPSGSIVTLEVLIARNRHIAFVAVPFWGLIFSSSVIAFMPIGVAAFPRPSILAAIFIIIALMAGCSAGTSGNSRTMTGRIARAIILIRPAVSATFIIPSHSAIAPIKLIARLTALLAESNEAVVISAILPVYAATMILTRIK